MKQIVGTVVEVFIPKQYQNDMLLDIMDRTNLGFKVMTEEGVKEIIVEQNEWNAQIMKNDMVLITEQMISNQLFIDIEAYGGE